MTTVKSEIHWKGYQKGSLFMNKKPLNIVICTIISLLLSQRNDKYLGDQLY